MDQPCGIRTKAMLPDWLASLEKMQKYKLDPESVKKLLSLPPYVGSGSCPVQKRGRQAGEEALRELEEYCKEWEESRR